MVVIAKDWEPIPEIAWPGSSPALRLSRLGALIPIRTTRMNCDRRYRLRYTDQCISIRERNALYSAESDVGQPVRPCAWIARRSPGSGAAWAATLATKVGARIRRIRRARAIGTRSRSVTDMAWPPSCRSERPAGRSARRDAPCPRAAGHHRCAARRSNTQRNHRA
jgi:hypothetical protein